MQLHLLSLSTEAYKTLNELLEKLEENDIDAECDGHSLSFEINERCYLLNYHGVAGQIWLSSPVTGAHHFRLEKKGWVSIRNNDHLVSLLEKELGIHFS
jgi:CyaY protein